MLPYFSKYFYSKTVRVLLSRDLFNVKWSWLKLYVIFLICRQITGRCLGIITPRFFITHHIWSLHIWSSTDLVPKSISLKQLRIIIQCDLSETKNMKFSCKVAKTQRQVQINLTFMGPCIASLFYYISNKIQRYTVYLNLGTALHVSGGTTTHYQEHIQLYLQHLLFVTPLLLPAAILQEVELEFQLFQDSSR